MSDIARQKYIRLITEVEDLEDKIENMEKDNNSDQSKILELKNKLAEKKTELARISDGCGTPHGHNL
jgi:hypothetical protein